MYHGFISYDFETVENVINKQISASTQLNSTLIPISVASCIHCESGDQTTIHFDAQDNDFIPMWIAALFKLVDQLLNEKIEFYSRILFKQPRNYLSIKKLYKIDSGMTCINVYGFNPSRLGSNLFKVFFNCE